MKKLILAIAILLVAGAARAQEANVALIAVDWDLDSTSMTYSLLRGLNGSPYGPDIPAIGCTVTTSGSSTTVTASAVDCYTVKNKLAAGDLMVIKLPTGVVYRVIDTVTDGDTIVVNDAITIASATAFGYYKFSTGTAATDGWVDVGGAAQVVMYGGYEQGDINTSLDLRFECRDGGIGQQPVQVYPDNSSGAAVHAIAIANKATLQGRVAVVVDVSAFTQCRIGALINSTDASDATTTREKVTLKIIKVSGDR